MIRLFTSRSLLHSGVSVPCQQCLVWSRTNSDLAWRPVSILDHPRTLPFRDEKKRAELKADKNTAAPWRSGRYATAPRCSSNEQLSAGSESKALPSGGVSDLVSALHVSASSKHLVNGSVGGSDQINSVNLSKLTYLAEKGVVSIDPGVLEKFARADVANKDPNEVLLLWRRLWSAASARPSSLAELSRLAVKANFYELTTESISFVALALASCAPLDNTDFLKMARSHYIDFTEQYSQDESATLAWALFRTGLLNDIALGKLFQLEEAASPTDELSWAGVCRVATVLRASNVHFPLLHTAIFERYVNNADEMSATELMFFAVAYRFGQHYRQALETETVDEAVLKVTERLLAASHQEQMDIFSLFSRDLFCLRRSHLPHVLMTNLAKSCAEITVPEACSVFDTLRVIKCLDAKFFVSPWLSHAAEALATLDTPTLLQVCHGALLHRCTDVVPLGDLLSRRGVDELRLLAKRDDRTALDLWSLHVRALTRGQPCLPYEVSRLCHVKALQAAQRESSELDAELDVAAMTRALVGAYNGHRRTGRRAAREDIAANLVLPTGHCLTVAMLFSVDRTVCSWDDLPDAMPWLSRELVQDSGGEELTWRRLDARVRGYAAELAAARLFPYGVLVVDYVTDVENKLKARLLTALGWNVTVMSRGEWTAALRDGDAESLLAAKFLRPVFNAQKSSGNVSNKDRTAAILDVYHRDSRRPSGRSRRR